MSRLDKAVEAAKAALANSGKGTHHSERHIRTIITAALAALEGDAQPVAVKALEWRFFDVKHEHGHGVWDANGPWSTFTIYDCEGWDATGERYYAPHLSKAFPTLDEAKAAAQADYEQRIRSALVATPPSPKLGVAVEALRRIRDDDQKPRPQIYGHFGRIAREALSQLEKPGE